jgi:3-hydroxyisobutyrate dehydrogenase-like beta-hydroxyacid dehydrogenase
MNNDLCTLADGRDARLPTSIGSEILLRREGTAGDTRIHGHRRKVTEPTTVIAAAWFDVGFMHKDIELALDAARRLEIPLPTAERADEVLEVAAALGYKHRDLAALFQALEQIAGDGAGKR